MRINPNPRLYSLYIDGVRVCEHAYKLEIATLVFGKRALLENQRGKKTELRPVRKATVK